VTAKPLLVARAGATADADELIVSARERLARLQAPALDRVRRRPAAHAERRCRGDLIAYATIV
jgi:hypothetical protein